MLSFLLGFLKAGGISFCLTTISTFYLKKRIERDGYKFIKKDILEVLMIINTIYTFVRWTNVIPIMSTILKFSLCLKSLYITFTKSGYEFILNDLLKGEEIEPINSLEVDAKVSLKKETKKREKKKLKPKRIETKVKEIPKEIEKESSNDKVIVESKSSKEKERIKEQVNLTKELDNSDAALVLKIQTLLVKLKKINPKIYESFNKEYEELAKSGKLSNFMLKEFLARILCSLEYDARDANILINYLDYLIVSYENKAPINNQISELSFKELEKIAREIINTSNLYSREYKIIIYKKLSLLYLYIIYDNKYINIDAIRNSCFNHDALLYAVILNIDDLIKRNLIEGNLLFDVNENYNLESILKLIGEIKFKNKKEKKLMY